MAPGSTRWHLRLGTARDPVPARRIRIAQQPWKTGKAQLKLSFVPELIDIGEVCALTGISPSTLHFYERKGLIASSEPPGTRRRYSAATLERLDVILLARRGGFALKEIGGLLAADASADPEARLETALAEVKERMLALAALEDRLTHALSCPDKRLLRCKHLRDRARSSPANASPRPRAGIAEAQAESTDRSETGRPLVDLVWLRKVRDRIDREYARPLDVEALARGANMSAGHLSRRFRQAYGELPYSYLMTRRVERAMALLQRGDLSVTEVCYAVGYSSISTFSARFTELVGMTPGAYRRASPNHLAGVPACLTKQVARPVRNREAPTGGL